MLPAKQSKNSRPLKVTRGEVELLKAFLAAGEDGFLARQLEGAELDSVSQISVRPLLSRMVGKGLLAVETTDKRTYRPGGPGRPRLRYRLTTLGRRYAHV